MNKLCICKSWDTRVTGHREDCPAISEVPPMTRQASPKKVKEEKKLIAIIRSLVKTVRAQEERIVKLENEIKSR